MTSLSRRAVLRGLGVGGLSLGLYPRIGIAAPKQAEGLKPNVFIHLKADGSLTLVCQRSEMGQGVRSTLPVIFADELGADMARVTIEQAVGDKVYGDQNTDGSKSIRGQLDWVRSLGATARTMLVAVAAKRWKVKPEDCEARDHAVFNKKTKARLEFGALADEASRLPVPDAASVKLRPRSELRRIGTSLPLLDAPAFVNGSAKFAADVTLPGMLIAVIARPPVVGGALKRFDAKATLAVPGVRKVVQLKEAVGAVGFQPWGGVAVLADNTWAAMQGRAALELEWDHGPNATYDSVAFRDELLASVDKPGEALRNVGDVDAALATAATKLEAEYYVPHLPHAPMEPPAALAHARDGRCDVWACTQNPQAARTNVAKVLGLDESAVTVNVTFLGGGFGRKSKADFPAEAALLSREVGAPVRVQWTREDDLHHDYVNTVSAQKLTCGLDASGKLIAWRHRTAFPPIASTFGDADRPGAGDLQQGVLDLALDVPNVRAEACVAKAHARIGWLRSVYNIFHAFSVGSFVGELAAARKTDLKATWLEVLGPPRQPTMEALGIKELRNYGEPIEKHPVDVGRLRGVIERVTAASEWDAREKHGRFFGLAAHRSFLSYVAAVVSVVKRGDKVAVDEVWIAADAGVVVNLERAHSQLEGAVIFGLNLALFGGLTYKNGAVEQSNFHQLKLARMHDVPRVIHTDVVTSDALSGGLGEPGVPPVAPALANAVFALTGKRVRQLPLTREVAF